MSRRSIRGACLAVGCCLALGTVRAQSSGDLKIEDARISPTLYFPSAAAELSSRETLQARVGPLAMEIAAANAPSFVAELDKGWELIGALQRHAAYLRVQSLENTQDQAVKSAAESVATSQSVLQAAIETRLRQVPAGQVASLGAYAFLATELQAAGAHSVTADAEAYRGAVTFAHEQAVSDAYDALMETLGNPKDIASPDFAKRRAAISQRNDAYDKAAPVAATLLASLIDLENRDAVAQGYANAADRKYDSLGLSTRIVDQTLTAVAADAPAYRNYEQVIAEHAGKRMGIATVLSAEVELAAAPPPPISLTQGRQMILEAFKPLGEDYTGRFGRLLDPANGRLDLSGGAHRSRTGTSISVYDAPVAFYYGGYDGSLRSLSTIAHEGGHAIHRELMNAGGNPIYEREGPHYLSEGFAIFNELLLLDHAAQVAKTPAERAYALERLLAKISLELFVSAEEATFERNLYTAASGHAMLDRGGIDKVYRETISPYEYWPMSDVGMSRGWMRKSLLFEDPLYLVNYLYAAFVAVALYDKAQTDPDFAAHYEALLRRGFDAPAETLLASMGIRLDDPGLAKDAAAFFEKKTAELKALYEAEK